jgi:hypothetical protein
MIYLREGGGQYVGPFKSRKDVERFVKLMELCGENWAGAEVIEEEGGIDPAARQTDLIR